MEQNGRNIRASTPTLIKKLKFIELADVEAGLSKKIFLLVFSTGIANKAMKNSSPGY
jgi:hypothetical protein